MNRKFLLLAGAIGALFAGKSATTMQPVPATDVEIGTEAPGAGYVIGADQIVSREPAPVSSDSIPAGTHQVAIRAKPLGLPSITRFNERPMRRKVKYGKGRWVILS